MSKNRETTRHNLVQENKSRGNKKPNRAEEIEARRDRNSNREYTRHNVASGKTYDLSRSKSNDPAYYNRIPSMYDPATKYGFTHIEGDVFNWVPNEDNDSHESMYHFPWGTWTGEGTQGTFNIMRVDYHATIGWVESVNSPINKAITMLMGELYSRLGASTLQFNGATLGYFLVGTSSISQIIALLRRALKTVKAFAPLNITYPRALVRAMGFDYEEIVENVDGYCEELNQVIRDFNNLRVPSFIAMFPRQFALCDNVYVDEDNAKADLTFFRPENYFEYVLNSETNKWYLKDTSLAWMGEPQNGEFRRVLDIVENALEGWLHAQDLHYVRGTILRAFKDDEYFIVPEISMSDTLAPVVDKYIPMQIDNMYIAGIPDLGSYYIDGDITEDIVGDYLISKPSSQTDFQWTDHQYWVIRKDNYDALNPDDFMEMTRLVCMPRWNADLSRVEFRYCSPEIVTGVDLFMYNRFTDQLKQVSVNCNYHYMGDNITDRWFAAAAALQSFRHRPLMVYLADDQTAYPMGDLVEYSRLPYEKWRQLQIAATYSIYSPTISGQIRQI